MSVDLAEWLAALKATLPSDSEEAREQVYMRLMALDESNKPTTVSIDDAKVALVTLMQELLGQDYYQEYLSRCTASASHASFVDRELRPFLLPVAGATLRFEQRIISKPEDLGNAVWEGAVQLTRLIAARPALVAGKRVLELGAGCGACGMAASCLGAADVVITDMHNIVPLLETNVAANRTALPGAVSVAPLDWTDDPLPELGAFDVILAADCIYVYSPLEALVSVVQRFAKRDAVVLFSYECHDDTSIVRFNEIAAAKGLKPGEFLLRAAGEQKVNIVQLHL